jgi:uncharacterized protein (DUF924 family)
MTEEAREVLDFWFGAPGSPQAGRSRAEWFRKDAAFDDDIRSRFGVLHQAAREGGRDAWQGAPETLLALIVVLDQFPRNMYRGSPDSFAADARALAAARRMVGNGWDRGLPPVRRMFVYLPYEHSEKLADQETCIDLMQSLLEDPQLSGIPGWAVKHHAVIARFGRFPHRNAILGRVSTPEEAAFLAQPGSSF